MAEFSKFQSIFMEDINNGRIGVCKWVESGTTLDTAVPELSQLTDDKDEWRAIIIRFEDEANMASFECDKHNPYDFAVNRNTENDIFENPVPLIRLTHMLGGVPSPAMDFVCEQEFDENKVPKIVYKPVVDENKNRMHSALCRKYQFDGKLPSSIVIISVREKASGTNTIGNVWNYYNENESSEFWRRNHYPSNSRFLVYDFEKQGPIQREADKFGFWLSTLMISINKIDSSALQAYKLYKLNTVVDKSIMAKEFHETMGRLKAARHLIEEEIKQDVMKQMLQGETLPDYKVEISISQKRPDNIEECTVNKNKFGLMSNGATTDMANWENMRVHVEQNLTDSIIAAERELDITADRMKRHCTFSEDEVLALDKYQEEDLKREIDELYNDVVMLQGELPDKNVGVDDETKKAAKGVRQYLSGRVVSKPALVAFIVALLLAVLSNVPAFVQYYQNGTGSINSILTVPCAEILLMAVAAKIALVIQKIQLNGLIETYNVSLKKHFDRLIYNASDYSRYISAVASHSRGKSYLNLAARKKYKVEQAQYSKYTHLSAINVFMAQIKTWSVAYHLNIDLNESFIDKEIYVDTSLVPSKNSLYKFDTSKGYDVPINNSGITIKSPFAFVKKIEILREEIYDDSSH